MSRITALRKSGDLGSLLNAAANMVTVRNACIAGCQNEFSNKKNRGRCSDACDFAFRGTEIQLDYNTIRVLKSRHASECKDFMPVYKNRCENVASNIFQNLFAQIPVEKPLVEIKDEPPPPAGEGDGRGGKGENGGNGTGVPVWAWWAGGAVLAAGGTYLVVKQVKKNKSKT